MHPAKTQTITSREYSLLLIALATVTLLKLYLAIATHGSTDVDGFTDHLLKIRELGVSAYRVRGPFDNPFNSPPPMIHVIRGLGFLSDTTGLPFKFWLRLLPIIGGLGSFFIVWRLLGHRKDLFALLLVLALCPISIMVDGYHGNTDSLVIMFVLLAVYLMERRAPVWLAGVAFGLGCSVKIVPLMFAPAFVLYLPGIGRRLQFALTAAVVFIACSMPYIVQDPIAVKNAVFGYGSIYGTWGIPQLAAIVSTVRYAHPPFEPLDTHAVIAAILKYLTLVLILAGSVWLNYKNKRPSLFLQFGAIIALVLFLAPGFGPQYLVWLVPFVPGLGIKSTLTYYIPASLYLLYKYTGLVDVPSLAPAGLMLGLFCWLSLLLLLAEYVRGLRYG